MRKLNKQSRQNKEKASKSRLFIAMKKAKITIRVDEKVQRGYKKFCHENGLVMQKRIEDLLRADLEKRLIKIPEMKL